MTSLASDLPLPLERPRLRWAALLGRRLGSAVAVLLAIAFLTYWGLTMAENAVQSLPVEPGVSAVSALRQTFDHVLDHPASYLVHREPVPAAVHILTLLRNSLALLLPALGVAFVAAIPLGLRAARSASRRVGSLVWLISILGVSVPAFMLAMFLWVINLEAGRRFSLTPLPATGLGFDLHLLLPVLVLSARPFAQLTQVTYITLRDLLEQDFVRTARGKGVPPPSIDRRHVLRNAWIPILTSVSTSLRFALATLPVVETFFVWPGIGLGLLEAIVAGDKTKAVDMVLALGVVFLLVNSILELGYPLLDPRLRDGAAGVERREEPSLRKTLRQWLERVRESLSERRAARQPTTAAVQVTPGGSAGRVLAAPDLPSAGLSWRRAVLTDPVFLVAAFLSVGLLGLVLFGSRLTEASPYVAHGVLVIEGEIGAPPYPPSSVFPWGTDQIGRDMRALVLYGARQTLSLALLVVAARLAVGVVGGMVSGWWQGGMFDRSVLGVLSVWAAFPITLFAMILILAVGIERGMPTFVLALCFVGWGEIAQYVRSEVIGLRGRPFLEGARAVGVPPEAVLLRHILPNLAPSILVLAALEMGAVLLLLAELGFLGIFLGGGYRVMIGEAGRMMPVIAHYSDVPEWSALLANIRLWWRSYPWLAWSPAVAFSLAILTFNLAGEALRRVFERSRVSPARWINRSSVIGAAAVMAGAVWIFNTTAPLGVYHTQADLFSVSRAMRVVEELASPRYGGRETGTVGAELAAEYIATEMEAIGLFPGGERVPGGAIETYFSRRAAPRLHLVDRPTLALIDASGGRQAMIYREDFAEYPLGNPSGSSFGRPVAGASDALRGTLIGVAAGPPPEGADQIPAPGAWAVGDVYGLSRMDLGENVLLIRESFVPYLPGGESAGILVVTDDPATLQERYLYPGLQSLRPGRRPVGAMLMIDPALADRLLAASGSSLEDLDRRSRELRAGEVYLTEPGLEVEFEIPVEMGPDLEEKYISVIGYIPGQGAEMDMDDDVILVSAYYDGLGTAPDGTLYPGANDNLSGVATLLELARVLQDGDYAPDKTIVFVAWAGGERWEGFSVVDAMSAKIGFNLLNVEAVIELSGVGGGSGGGIALGQGTSFRLTRLIEAAAGKTGTAVTTRGTDPHFGMPRALGFGQRDALSAYVSWDGSDELAHLPLDSPENLDPDALESVGRTMSLVLTVVSRETEY